MNRELNIFTLRMLREQYEAEHLDTEAEALDAAIEALEIEKLPTADTESAYAEGWTAAESKYRAMMSDGDCISRQAVIEAVVAWTVEDRPDIEMPTDLVGRIESLPSAQPEPHYDEWRTDCKEYDNDKQCCPRWNKVIRNTLADAQPEIIRCKDCRYAHLTRDGKCKYCDTWTDVDGYPLDLYVEGEFYCGNAERRTDETKNA